MEQRTVRVGVVGAGYWGPNLVRNFYGLDNVDVTYVCDLDDAKLAPIRASYPTVKTTQDVTDLYTDPQLDAVVIATPVFAHFPLASEALKHGKHVLLEKPMAPTAEQCQTLIDLAKQNNCLLMVDHTFLYTGAVRKIKSLIDEGELGETYYFDSERINLGLIQPDVNVIWDLAPHDISIMNHIFGDARPVSVYATGTNHVTGKVEEMAHITVKYDSGAVGHIHASWISPIKIRKILVGGSKKMVLYNDMSPDEKIKVYDKSIANIGDESVFKPNYRAGDMYAPKLDGTEALKREAQHFVDCIRGTDTPLVDGQAGLDVVRILEACDKSIAEGREISLKASTPRKRILVCAAGGAPATNFVRSLREMNEDVFLVGVDCDKYTLQRAETDVSLLVPRANDPDYIAVLNNIIDEYNIEFVHAQNDYELEVLSACRDDVHAKLFLPAKETVDICLNKFASYEAWKQAGIRVPETMLIHTKEDLKQAFDIFGPKLWLRDIKGAAGKGSFPTESYDEAVKWIDFKNGWEHFTAARYLSEKSITWMSVWHEGKLVVAQSRKRMYWEFANRAPSGVTGLTGTGVTVSDPIFDELAINSILAIDSKPHGIFSVDMTYDADGLPNPTEINIGRFFTTHYFFTKAGLNMPEIYTKLAYGEPIERIETQVNPLPDDLAWVRGMDVEPILTHTSDIDMHEQKLKERLSNI